MVIGPGQAGWRIFSSALRMVATAALVGVAVPGAAFAQSADDLAGVRQRLKQGQMVVVTDATGNETKGRFSELSDGTLVLLLRERTRDNRGAENDTWTATRTFAAADIREIRKHDGLGNGTAIGLAIGAGPAIAFGIYVTAVCANEGGVNCPTLKTLPLLFAAGGAALGAAIDAAIDGNTVLYVARTSAAEFRIKPILNGPSRGAALSIRF